MTAETLIHSLSLDQHWNEGKHQLYRTEVIQIHGSTEVMQAIECVEYGAADRLTCIVDENVDPTQLVN